MQFLRGELFFFKGIFVRQVADLLWCYGSNCALENEKLSSLEISYNMFHVSIGCFWLLRNLGLN